MDFWGYISAVGRKTSKKFSSRQDPVLPLKNQNYLLNPNQVNGNITESGVRRPAWNPRSHVD